MKNKIILSVNDNPAYLYYAPITCWAWEQFGWEPILFYHGKFTKLNELTDLVLSEKTKNTKGYVLNVDGFESETITQVSRLYAACIAEEDEYLMTGDIDMLPLSDYWKPVDENAITSWGHNLTDYQHYPICYIGMPRNRWVEVMGITSPDYDKLIERDLKMLPQAVDQDRVKRWVTDQDLITMRINATQFKKDSINRGILPNGYARGRVDRSSWGMHHAWGFNDDSLIDCHMFRAEFDKHWISNQKFCQTLDLLKLVWPKEDFQWFIDYSLHFDQIVNI